MTLQITFGYNIDKQLEVIHASIRSSGARAEHVTITCQGMITSRAKTRQHHAVYQS